MPFLPCRSANAQKLSVNKVIILKKLFRADIALMFAEWVSLALLADCYGTVFQQTSLCEKTMLFGIEISGAKLLAIVGKARDEHQVTRCAEIFFRRILGWIIKRLEY